jgi:CBS domain-containing protein
VAAEPTTIAGIMHASPVTIAPTETLATAQALMDHEGVRQLPVVENGKLIGMLSERDLHGHIGYLERTKVDAAMSGSPVTVAPTELAERATRILLEHKVNALPVVEGGGQLVGVVSRSDLLRLLITLIERHG